MLSLKSLGFDPFFSTQANALAAPDLTPARIAADGQAEFWLMGSEPKLATLAGRLIGGNARTERPVVGDWVLVRDGERAVIHHLLDRRTALTRRAIGREDKPQVIAANVDVIFVVTSANDDLNLRRLERYLAIVWESGARPIVVINKMDLRDDAATLVRDVESVALGVSVLTSSATGELGAEALREHFREGQTAALVGSSGVGKSSLINRLIGREVQATSGLIRGDRGRHTTTRRELFMLPEGGMLMDTPGMRELGLIDTGEGVETAFPDIMELAKRCRFHDCKHMGDHGCAIEAAVRNGELEAERYDSYTRMQKELATTTRRSATGSRSRKR